MERIGTHLTQTDRLGQVKLENRHLVTGALLAQHTTTVATAGGIYGNA